MQNCNAIGHGYLQCPSVDKEVLPSSSCSQLDADLACLFVSQHKTDIDMSEASKAIGTPVPFNAMPDPALSNAELPAVSGSLNVLSPNGLTMMFHGMIAVNHGKIPVRTLADTGASHCYISQSFVEKAGIPVRPLSNWLKLANGSNAVSNGTCTLSLDIQSYCGPIECFVLPLSEQFDLIIGDDWCNEVGCASWPLHPWVVL